MAIPQITDRALLRRRLKRALRAGGPDKYFLVDRAMEDIATRLSAVSRHFPTALVINGLTAVAADRIMHSGKVGTVFRMEPVEPQPGCGTANVFIGDEEKLPIAPASADLIVSPLTLQFVNDLPGALLQICRALKPDGLFLGSLLGGDTLAELRLAFAEAEEIVRGGASPRFLPLSDVRDLGGLLQRAGFALPVADREVVTVRYDTAFNLMRDLKWMGASNTLADRDRTPASRTLLAEAAEIYRLRHSDPDGRIRATFEIISLSGWAPHESQQKPAKRGSAQVSLAEILGKKSAGSD